MTWESKHFGACTPDDVFDFAKLRTDIFFVEQRCDEEELDAFDRDPRTIHIWCRDGQRMVGYARVVYREDVDPLDRGVPWSIGRVVVDKDFRGKGLAGVLVEKCLEAIGPRDVVLHAQDYVTSLYQKHGFEAFGEPFNEAGIVHRRMIRAALQ